MTAKTESQHAGAFIAAELDHSLSRSTGTLASGQNLIDGTAVMLNGSSKLVAADGSGTSGELDGTVVGILVGPWDASGGDIAGVPYISNNAFYKESLVTFPSQATEEDSVETALEAKFIRAV